MVILAKLAKPRRRNRRRRNVKSRRRPKLGRPSRGLTQSVYKFKTRAVTSVILNDLSPASGFSVVSNGAVKRWSWRLQDLPGYAKYQGLFKMYKLDWVKVEIFCSQNTTTTNNEQIMCYTSPNIIGKQDAGLNETDFLETQAMRKQVMLVNSKTPFTTLHKVKQLSMRYGSSNVADQTDYAAVKPRWIDVFEDATEHYGYLQRFQLVNDTGLPNITMKIITTVGLSFKGVV